MRVRKLPGYRNTGPGAGTPAQPLGKRCGGVALACRYDDIPQDFAGRNVPGARQRAPGVTLNSRETRREPFGPQARGDHLPLKLPDADPRRRCVLRGCGNAGRVRGRACLFAFVSHGGG